MKTENWIDPREIRFYHRPDGWLAAEWGNRRGPVTARRLFPVSEPDGMILIRDLDGEVWGMIRRADELDPPSRQALRQELRINPYMPGIRSVTSLQRKNQQFEWVVLTDFGHMRFYTDPLYESVLERPDGRRVITDKSGQCYVLPADYDLDKKSAKKLKRWF
jgi:hypothetical protein